MATSIEKIRARMRGGGVNLPAGPQVIQEQQAVAPPSLPKAEPAAELASVHAHDESDEEDKKEPESEAWTPPEKDGEPLEVNAPEWDWRRNTKKGRKSRLNFSLYIARRLRAGQPLA